MKAQKYAVQHVMDWSCGEAYFAIVRGGEIVKRLDRRPTSKEAAALLKAFRAAQA